ncbi:replicative DNA helicase [Desulfobulbus rhabdoformis]|uniref:replicative DNA helicase n=1 Tax=Desulfobulbus rhabdoformis TaxID=34032 RepID=UPI001963DD12|nr:replicative DNA helicase [Desulfobulbus rhabdoformis]MBM9616650.1 replicative DNA helicase [Desulfobulbus rhabdoformis]
MTKINDTMKQNSIEAERCLIGACLVDMKSAVTAVDLVRPGEMQHPKHGIIFNAIIETVQNGGMPEMVTIYPLIAGKVDASFLSDVTNNPIVGPAHVRQWAGVIKRQARLQSLAEAGEALVIEARSPLADPEELAASHILKFICDNAHTGKSVGMSEAVPKTMQAIEARGKGEEAPGILTGFMAFDRMKQGLRGGEFIVFGGRPGGGKSALAGNIAVEVAKQGAHVKIFSLEMTRDDFIERMISAAAGVNLQSIRSGQFDDYQHDRVKRAGAMIANLPINIDDTGGLTIGQIGGRARESVLKSKVDLIIVDYLQLVKGKGDTRQQQVGDVTRALKALAKDLNVPVIGLAQLNRGLEGREDKRPRLSDLRESGDIEQDADMVGLLYRIECGSDSPMYGKAELIIAKHRNGPTGKVDLKFEGHFSRFKEA